MSLIHTLKSTGSSGGGSVNSVTPADATIAVTGTSTDPIIGAGILAARLTPTVPKTSAYTAAAGEFVPCDTATTGAFTVTLPTAPADKTQVGIKHIVQGSSNVVTYTCGGSDTLNKVGGATSGTLSKLAQSVLLQYNAALAVWYILAADGTGLPDVQVFATAGTFTWTKPARATVTEGFVYGAAGSGGGGRRGATGSTRCGGGGGAGGCYAHGTFPTATLSSTEQVIVGAGGAAKAGATADDTNGTAGSAGGASSFRTSGGLTAAGGGGGLGGTNANGVGGVPGTTGHSLGGAGGAAGTTGLAGVAAVAAVAWGAPGGGPGGGITSADAVSSGASGGASNLGAGGAGGAAGADGTAGTNAPTNTPLAGTGGGGGSASKTANAGAGAAGGSCGAGGGGGGASLNGFTGGPSGAGADGRVVLVSY